MSIAIKAATRALPHLTELATRTDVPLVRQVLKATSGAFTGLHGGYAGTTLESLGKEALTTRLLPDRRSRMYFASPTVASEYALSKCWAPVGHTSWYHHNKSTPVIMGISSDVTPGRNDPITEPGLFDFYYFKPGSKVYLDSLWILRDHLNPDKFPKGGALSALLGLDSTERAAAFFMRNILKTHIRY